MSAIIQFDLFKTREESELASLRKYCDEVSESANKVRKSLFARNGELNKRMLDLETRMHIIEVNLCKNMK